MPARFNCEPTKLLHQHIAQKIFRPSPIQRPDCIITVTPILHEDEGEA